MPRIHDSSGVELDATFSVALEQDVPVVYVESRGGERNRDYGPGLELLLQRIGTFPALIADALVASGDTKHLDENDRRIRVPGHPFPVDVRALSDVRDLRLAMGRAAAAVGRLPDASGPGNATKRLRLVLAWLRGATDPTELERWLQRSRVRRHWAFLANPKRYRIADAVQGLQIDLWTIKDRPIAAGDRALIWQARGMGGQRGVVALAEVVSEPTQVADTGNPYWIEKADADAIEQRVHVRYVRPPGLPLWFDAQENEFLGALSVARGQGTIFRITHEQWERVVAAAGGWDDRSWQTVVASASGRPSQPGGGQGWSLNAAERKVVETYAMRLAKNYFDSRGIRYLDVSATASYDLHCYDGEQEIYVEVKGTTTGGESVLLSFNEVELASAKYPDTALIVTSGIVLDRQQNPPTAYGGRTRVIRPWLPSPYSLKPISYECTLGPEYGLECSGFASQISSDDT